MESLGQTCLYGERMHRHVHKCTHAFMQKIAPLLQKCMQRNRPRGCNTYAAEASPPSRCGGAAFRQKKHPQKSLVKNDKAQFPRALWLRVYVTKGALSPTVVGIKSR